MALTHACGATYEADAVFCPGCWQPVASTAMPVAARPATVVTCPHCDRETPAGERCVRCLDSLLPEDPTIEQAVEDVDEWQRVNLPGPLRDSYTFLRELPSGGQADVLICSDVRDPNHLVVVKVYRPGMSLEDAAIDELRAGATDRSHVVPILDFGRTGGVAWEVQEYVPGGSLADVFKRRAPFADLSVALRLTRQLWAAITYLHERHLIHRDLKPSNVLVHSEDPLDIALADFGLVAILDATLDIRTVVGTTTYLPPESRGNIVSKSMDWWAMGLILVEALTGRHLFAGADGMLADAVVRNQLYEGTFAIPTTGSPRWDALLAGLLAVDYEQRWGSAEVADWLQGRAVLPKGVPAERRGGSVPFDFAGRSWSEPAALAEALRADSASALRLLAGPQADQLRDWLRRTPVGDAAEDLLLNASDDPDGALVRLQLVLDPSRPPAFRNRLLTNAGLNSVIRAAADGDVSAGTWIQQLREQRILSAWSAAASDLPATVARADELLRTEWAVIDTRLAAAPALIRRSVRAPLEAALLEVALKPSSRAHLIDGGRAAARGPAYGWAEPIAHAARAPEPSIADAALAHVALPKAQQAQAVRAEVEQVASTTARSAERVAVRNTRVQAMLDELARTWWISLGAIAAVAWGLHAWTGQDWGLAGAWAAVLGGATAVAIGARHLIAPAPHATVGWAFFTAALAGGGQSFATSFHGTPPHVALSSWWTLAGYAVLGAWLARGVNLVVSARVRDLPVPDTIPAQWLRRPALVAAVVALLADACRRYAEVAAATHGRVGQTLATLGTQSDGVHHAATRTADVLHPFALGLPASVAGITAAFVATVFLFGSPDLARLHSRLLTATRAAVLVLAVVAAATSATALVLVAALAGPAVWIALVGIGAAVLVAADLASA
jgi:hypothetical protein